jgi:hypothetical protein
MKIMGKRQAASPLSCLQRNGLADEIGRGAGSGGKEESRANASTLWPQPQGIGFTAIPTAQLACKRSASIAESSN